MKDMLELSDKYFKTSIKRMHQQAIMNMLKTSKKLKVSGKRSYKEAPSGNSRAETYNI